MVIYKITNNINNKIYIGLTTLKNPIRRFKNHISTSLGNYPRNPLRNAIKKYGEENFKFEVIYHSFSLEDLNEKEIYFISLYNSTNRDIGYNIQSGGNFSKHTEETKKKIAKSSIGLKVGFKHSQESRKKMSESHKNKKLSQEHINKKSKTYYFKNENNEIIEIFNLNKFCRDNNLDHRSMLRLVKGEYEYYKGFYSINYVFKYFKGISPDGEVHLFKRIRDTKKFNLDSTKVSAVLKNKRKFHRGWTFSYIEGII